MACLWDAKPMAFAVLQKGSNLNAQKFLVKGQSTVWTQVKTSLQTDGWMHTTLNIV